MTHRQKGTVALRKPLVVGLVAGGGVLVVLLAALFGAELSVKVQTPSVRVSPSRVERGERATVSWSAFDRKKYSSVRLSLCRAEGLKRTTLAKNCRLLHATLPNEEKATIAVPEDTAPGKYKILVQAPGKDQGRVFQISNAFTVDEREGGRGSDGGSGGSGGGKTKASPSPTPPGTPAPSPSPTPPGASASPTAPPSQTSAVIQGRKLGGESQPDSRVDALAIVLDKGQPGAQTSTSNPYRFEASPGRHTLSLATPPGEWNVKYAPCFDSACSEQRSGTSVEVNITPQTKFVDINWMLAPRQQATTVRGVVAKVTIEPSEAVIALKDIAFNDDPADPSSSYYIRVAMPVTCNIAGKLERAIRAQSGLLDLFRSCAPKPGTPIHDNRDVGVQQRVTRVDQIKVGDTVTATGTSAYGLLEADNVTVIGRRQGGDGSTTAFVTGTFLEVRGPTEGFYSVELVQTSIVDSQQRPVPGDGSHVYIRLRASDSIIDGSGGAPLQVSPGTLRAGDRVSVRGTALAGDGVVLKDATNFRITERAPIIPLNAMFIHVGVPSSVAPNERFPVTIMVKNIGTETWVADSPHPVRLGLNAGPRGGWDKADAPHHRVNLTEPVRPSDIVYFRFTARAPSAPGPYTTDFQMVKEFVQFFGPLRRIPVEVRALPSDSRGLR